MGRIKAYTLISAVLLAALAAGCARGYLVKVDSIRGMAPVENKTYVLAAGNKDTDRDDLQFQEYAFHLARALKERGYTQLEFKDRAKAGLIIFLSYGIGEPQQHTYSYSAPVWGVVGTWENSYATIRQEDGETRIHAYRSTDPQYGVTGYETRTRSYVTYKKFLVVDTYSTKDTKENGEMKNIWKTTSCMSDGIRDLRRVIPYMIEASSKYFGENTSREIEVMVKEK
ncbi:MAG TPA: DUF4136 domain-containing protein [bacterium]|nr:DUF4136 domain-containing protein [bacterium]